jgi:hypothetical protein
LQSILHYYLSQAELAIYDKRIMKVN